MKQYWSEFEIEIAEFVVTEFYKRFSLLSNVSYSWGCKKKRSAIQNTSSSSQMIHGGVDGGAVAVVKRSGDDAVKAQASSPATPLSFPATESDEKTKHSKIHKTSLKRKREYYLNMIEDLTKTKDSINQEIENVKRHCEQLKDFNLKLKAKEKELSNNGPKGECKNPNLEINHPMQLNHVIKGSDNSSNSTAESEQEHKKNHQKMKMEITNHNNINNFGLSQICNGNPTTSLPVASSGLGRDSNMGPLSIPDLNLSIEESVHVDTCQPLDEATSSKDLSKVMAAQARQRRIQIFRLKKPVGNNGKQRQSSYR